MSVFPGLLSWGLAQRRDRCHEHLVAFAYTLRRHNAHVTSVLSQAHTLWQPSTRSPGAQERPVVTRPRPLPSFSSSTGCPSADGEKTWKLRPRKLLVPTKESELKTVIVICP